MAVALVSHVEHQAVPVGRKYPVNGHGELHHAQVGGQVPACMGDTVHQARPHLLTQLLGLGVCDLA